MRNNRTNENIEELTAADERLRLVQENLHSAIARFNTERQNEIEIVPELPRVAKIPVARIVRRTRPEIGTTIRIKNPCFFQQHNGVVVGFTRTGFVIIQTPSGDEVKRIPRNLKIID